MAEVTDTGILTRGQAAKELQENYRTIYREPITKERAMRILEIAQEFGRRAEPCDGGFVHVVVRPVSKEWPYTERFQIYNHATPSPGKVALPRRVRYAEGYAPKPAKATNHKKEIVRPAARRRAATKVVEPEPQVEEEAEFDPTPWLQKGLTPTMQDYVTWWKDVVGDPDEMESEVLITLGARFYTYFQKSEFNIANREARRAEREEGRAARAAANGDAEEEEPGEEEAPPRRRGAAAKAPTRKPAAKAAPAAPAKPAARTRKAKTY